MDAQGRIKDMMMERGWTEYRLAKESGLSHSTVTNMFKRNNAPTLPTLEAVCAAFGITLAQFFAEGNPLELTEEQQTPVMIGRGLFQYGQPEPVIKFGDDVLALGKEKQECAHRIRFGLPFLTAAAGK